MDRRLFMKTAGTVGAGFLLGRFKEWVKTDTTKQTTKPNFLFILIDDMGWKDAGCFGSTFYQTPNIDRLSAEGMRFTDGYAASPVCSPTRASIMTGKYPARMDTTDWFGAIQPDKVKDLPDNKWYSYSKYLPLLGAKYKEYLPSEEVTIAESLRQAGYRTFFAGKWHLGETEKYWPENQGFDVNKGGWKAGNPGNDYFSPYNNPRLEDGPKGEHLPDRLANETVKFITDNKTDPFLAFLSFYSVHTPLKARKDLEQKYIAKKKTIKINGPIYGTEGERKVRLVQDHAVYAGMVEAIDLAIGKVMDALRDNGLDGNTAVMFMSDNGGLSTSEGSPTSNFPLRAGKGWIYEGGIREPFIIKWPGVTKPGSVCSESVTSTDFYPTMLDMAQLPLKPLKHKDGVSLVELLKGKKMDRGPIYWHYPHYSPQGGSPASAIRDGNWKLIVWYEDNRRELYNLKDDIAEHNNINDKNPGVSDKLYTKLQAWLLETNANMPTLNPSLIRETPDRGCR
jgi:arylsulfatase A-like enzyme